MAGSLSLEWLGGRGITLLKESHDASASGFVCTFLKHAIAKGHRVLLVTVGSTEVHYKAVMRKMGTILEKASSQLQLLDLLHDCTDPSRQVELPSAAAMLETLQMRWKVLCEGGQSTLLMDDLTSVSLMLQDSSPAMLQIIRGIFAMVLGKGSGASALLVTNTDVTGDNGWQKLLETSVDVCVHLQALPTGKITNDNVKVAVFRQNRWGYAGREGQEGGLETEENLFGYVTDKFVQLRHAS